MYRALNNRVYLGEAVHKGTAHQGEHEAIIDRGLWDRVHAVIDPSPRAHTKRQLGRTPALLKGLIFGPTGAAMTPTHTRENGRLYRYYVASDVIRTGNSPSPIRRVPAAQIEDAVIAQIRTLVQTPEIDPAAGYGLQRKRGMPRKQSNAVTSTTITVHVPMTFPVYGGHKAIISEIVCAPGEKPGRLPERSKAPAAAVQSPPQRTENALLKALARAHRCALSRSALGQFPDPAATSQEPADGVEMWRGGCRLHISVAASFDWRCLSGSTMAPFPHPAHRTGQADFPHPALGQDFTLCFRVRRHL